MKNTFVDDGKYIMHRSHKYIKKVWKNGRWRYYYKDKNIKFLDNAAAKIGLNAMEKYNQSYSSYNKARKAYEDYSNAKEGSSKVLTRRRLNMQKAKETAEKAYIKYYTTPLGKLERTTTYEVGKSAVKQIINNIKNKAWNLTPFEVAAMKRKAPFKVSTNNTLKATRRVETVTVPSDKLYKK